MTKSESGLRGSPELINPLLLLGSDTEVPPDIWDLGVVANLLIFQELAFLDNFIPILKLV
eukprot:CAMPEP_0184301368 /NCGR_PEP_ID=MMETSP1049-20130417/11595_1 /TAXON_ID=77928 /ORGANISM="Proteomonas sulcata, Strain CCMP704" /LENGTH=59 /DNA_ID=CAMNT_0026612357 /DNA_START=67 /DNA_END=246 /DNA_ORIENTATION=-